MLEHNKEKLLLILDKYSITKKEKEEFIKMINPIFIHQEFQERMTDKFLHHGNITLGEHILEDTVLTYIYIVKNARKK